MDIYNYFGENYYSLCLYCNDLVCTNEAEFIETNDGWFCHNDCMKSYYPNEE